MIGVYAGLSVKPEHVEEFLKTKATSATTSVLSPKPSLLSSSVGNPRLC